MTQASDSTTEEADALISVGFADGTTETALQAFALDAQAVSATNSAYLNTGVISESSDSALEGRMGFNSFITDGVRLDYGAAFDQAYRGYVILMKGADNADVTGLQADLAVMRGSIEMYRYEHAAFPVALNIVLQLTQVTQKDGLPWASGEKYGPYIVKVPPLKTGAHKGDTGIVGIAGPPIGENAAANGWLYDESVGSIWANDANHFDK